VAIDNLRKTRNNIRNMRNNILDSLFPHNRQQILSTLLMDPQRRWYLSDLAKHLHVQPSSLQRELSSLAGIGLLLRQPDGNRVYYQTDTSFPLYPELRGIVIKTSGLVKRVCETLAPFAESLDFAFIHGSVARDEQSGRSDVDLMLIGALRLADLSLGLRELERDLRISVNVTNYTLTEFRHKLASHNNFLQTVMQDRKIFLKGTADGLERATSGWEASLAHNEQERA
jgi:predicted nucleotidyltransferase